MEADGRQGETDRERLVKTDSGDREDDFFCISISNSFDAENLSVCNENHYELNFLSRGLSTLIAPLWINTLIVVYLISI